MGRVKPSQSLVADRYSWQHRDHRISREELRANLDVYSRQPFQDVLSQLLQCQPDPVSIYAWACAAPDKWANAVQIIAKLSGYTEKMEIDLSGSLNVSGISDADLLQRLMELRNKLMAAGMTATNGATGPPIQGDRQNLTGPVTIDNESMVNATSKKKRGAP